MKFLGSIKEFIELEHIDTNNYYLLENNTEESLLVLWFLEDANDLTINGEPITFQKNQIVFLTEFHHLCLHKIRNARLIRFNRPFYCVVDHDAEVGCKGLLFFGASQLPVITIPNEELNIFNTLWEMFLIEMNSNDNLQIQMLQMMLKRCLILCTRIYKSQHAFPTENENSDLIRDFNFLVEKHFRTKHLVADYANLLAKSPKTLSNLFSKIGFHSPLFYIQNRILIEAKKLLFYSKKSIKEIAIEIGFDDIQAFSRFFKKKTNISPSQFRLNSTKEE